MGNAPLVVWPSQSDQTDAGAPDEDTKRGLAEVGGYGKALHDDLDLHHVTPRGAEGGKKRKKQQLIRRMEIREMEGKIRSR